MNNSTKPFIVRNCALAAIATGERANSLLELRDKLAIVDEGCLYYHFWSGHLHPQFVHNQHHNDFASWVFHRLHDNVLAEKLSVIDPTEYDSMEDLRQDVLEVIEERLDEHEIILWTKKEDQFHFICATIIIFEGNFTITLPKELAKAIELLPPSSIFYHFIDARKRTVERTDDFSIWLKTFGDHFDELIDSIQAIDPYFLSLTQIREELASTCKNYFEKIEV